MEERLKGQGGVPTVVQEPAIDTEMQQRLEAAEADLARAMNENARIQSELETAQAAVSQPVEVDTELQGRLDATEAELTRLSDENERIRTELDVAKAAESKLAEVETERTSLLQRLQDADAEIGQLRSSAASDVYKRQASLYLWPVLGQP